MPRTVSCSSTQIRPNVGSAKTQWLDRYRIPAISLRENPTQGVLKSTCLVAKRKPKQQRWANRFNETGQYMMSSAQ
eukprot:1161695-Pelagomonas_calceolata.AAC.10